MTPLGPGVITALAALLALLARVGTERGDALLALASRTSLRGGALPFKGARELGERLQLFEERGDGMLEVTPKGKELLPLLGNEPEPSEAFREMVACLALTAAPVLALGATLDVRRGALKLRRADGDVLLSWLEEMGLARRRGDGWTLVGLGKILAVGPLAATEDPEPDLRADVGARGEALSLRYESERLGGGALPVQVSGISAVFGFDILSRSGNAEVEDAIAIEVKASQSATEVGVFMTRHEAIVARRVGERYWLHAWGNVSVGEPLGEQYGRLRRSGYPIVIRHVAQALGDPALDLLSPRESRNGWSVKASELRWELPVPGLPVRTTA